MKCKHERAEKYRESDIGDIIICSDCGALGHDGGGDIFYSDPDIHYTMVDAEHVPDTLYLSLVYATEPRMSYTECVLALLQAYHRGEMRECTEPGYDPLTEPVYLLGQYLYTFNLDALGRAAHEIVRLEIACENERMRLVACGVAALTNIDGKGRLQPDHPYYSDSYAQVCAAVDREIGWRTMCQAALFTLLEHENQPVVACAFAKKILRGEPVND